MAEGFRELVRDVAAAHHHALFGRVHVLANGGGLVPVLEVEDALHVRRGARRGQRIWPPARGDEQPVVLEGASVGGGRQPSLGVELCDLGFAQQLDTLVLVLLRRAQEDLFTLGLVAQERR